MPKSEKSNRPGIREKKSLLGERTVAALRLIERCALCPRKCGANRLRGKLGFCGIGSRARVASYGPHFGEESVLVGSSGSGAVFFSGCNLHCVFCQNEDISRVDTAGDRACDALDPERLAGFMLELQGKGCCNINLVTPSHVVPQILAALKKAVDRGLTLPVVYNSSGYDSVETLRLLDGIVDIYMPDFKFWSRASSVRYLGAEEYPRVCREALIEMHRQVGDLVVDPQGIAVRGLLVRHLVMPGLLEETGRIMQFLAETLSTETFVNVMDQYHPCYRAVEFAEINRGLRVDEYEQAMHKARAAGLHRFEERDLARLLALLGRRNDKGSV